MHSRSSFLRSIWIVVFFLLVSNLFLLFFFPSSPYSPSQPNPVQALEQDKESFKRLSFWQNLWRKNEPIIEKKFSAFDGLEIDPDSDERMISVMIDNHSLARAQHSGIRSASIVYEALVEGGITRLMLLFPYQDLKRVGPVRSARNYFVDIAEEYGGLYIHAGGSPNALDQLWKSDRVYSVEEDIELGKSGYSFRDDQYDPPHNLFFNLLLTKLWAEDRNYVLSEPKKTWCFNEQDKIGLNEISLIQLNYSNDKASSYFVQFQYDEKTQNYKRYYGYSDPKAHMDSADSLQVSPTNLVVQIAPTSLIEGDEKERLDMRNIGKGKAFFFSRGRMLDGKWKKASESSVTEFYDMDGESICFYPGQIWVGILDDESLIEVE